MILPALEWKVGDRVYAPLGPSGELHAAEIIGVASKSFDGGRPCFTVRAPHYPRDGELGTADVMARELVARTRHDYCRRCGRETDSMGGHLTEAECKAAAKQRDLRDIPDPPTKEWLSLQDRLRIGDRNRHRVTKAEALQDARAAEPLRLEVGDQFTEGAHTLTITHIMRRDGIVIGVDWSSTDGHTYTQAPLYVRGRLKDGRWQPVMATMTVSGDKPPSAKTAAALQDLKQAATNLLKAKRKGNTRSPLTAGEESALEQETK